MIEIEKLLGIVTESGLKAEEQAAFHKVARPDGAKAIYIAKTQKVTRVDLSGFTLEHAAIKQITADEAKELKIGRVRGQLDFTKDETVVLSAFRAALRAVKGRPSRSKKGSTKKGVASAPPA
jgi:hypothetical protein